MRHIALSEAKDHLSEFVAAAEAGEEIVITRHGRPAAKLVAIAEHSVRQAKAKEAVAALKAHRQAMRAAGMTATVEELIAWKNEGRP